MKDKDNISWPSNFVNYLFEWETCHNPEEKIIVQTVWVKKGPFVAQNIIQPDK